jgi:hypothetical protein
VLAAADGRLTVACGQGALDLLQLQRPGGRRIDAAAFLQRVFIRADLNVPQDDAGPSPRTPASAPGALHPHGAGRRRGGDGHQPPGPPDRR